MPSVGPEPKAVAGPGGSIWGSALVYTVGALALQGVNFLLMPVFSHVMTGAEMGRAVNYLFWSTVFGIVISLQLHGALNNVVTHYGRESLAAFIRAAVPLYLGPTVVLLAVLVLARAWWTEWLGLPWGWLALAVVNGLCIAATMMALSQAVVTGRRVRYLLLSFLATVAGALVGLVLIALMSDDSLARVLGYLSGSVLVVLVLLPEVLRGGTRRSVRGVGFLAFALPVALPLLAHELLWQGTANANRVLLLRLQNATDAGIFAFAATLGGAAALTATAVNAAWTPWYFANTKVGANTATRAAASDLLGAMALMMAVGILVGPEVLRLVSGRDFWPGAKLVPFFVAVGIGIFVFNLAANYLVYMRRTGLVLVVSAAGCAATLGLTVAVIPVWGSVGVAAVSFGTVACMALAALTIGHRLGCRNLPQPLMVVVVLGTTGLLAASSLLADVAPLRIVGALVSLLALATLVVVRFRRRSRTAPP